MEALIDVTKEYGLWAALALFFVWQAWLRENRLSTAIDKANDYIATKMAVIIAENTRAFSDFAAVMNHRREARDLDHDSHHDSHHERGPRP